MEQSLADRGDEEEFIDTKVEGVHSTDSQQQPSQVFLYCVILAYILLIMQYISNF